MKNLTLKGLAEKLNGKYWEKGDKQRVYLDRGHNTKKMKTTTYVCQLDNGDFKVCCYVDCPSQDWNWIKSQQQQIIDSVQEDLDQLIEQENSDIIYCLVNPKGEYVDEFNKVVNIEDLYTDDYFFTEGKAIASLEERPESLSLTIKEFNKEKFFSVQKDCKSITND